MTVQPDTDLLTFSYSSPRGLTKVFLLESTRLHKTASKFIDESLIVNGGSKRDLSLSANCLDIENHLSDPNTPTPIEAVVWISQADSDSDDNVPLSSLQVPKADKERKRRKQFKRVYVEKCVFVEDGIVNIDVQDPSTMQVFAKTGGLEGLLSLLKTESERYAEQNGKMLQTTLEEKLPPQKVSTNF